ncbi:MAG: hypothetical protein QNJ15_05120 [Erythrobacter sp.]|nr:hypothetical protein [Erythrobacter sp.]
MSSDERLEVSSIEEQSFLFRIVQAQIFAQRGVPGTEARTLNGVDEEYSSFFNLRPIRLDWGPPTRHIEIFSIRSSNPQRYRIKKKRETIVAPEADNDYSDYWNKISAKMEDRGFIDHDGDDLGGRRTRFDMDLSDDESGGNKILVLHFDDTSNPNHKTSFFSESSNIYVGKPADLALMGYSPGMFGTMVHGAFRGAVFGGNGAKTIMIYCTPFGGAPQRFALGVSISDEDRPLGDFKTDIVVDPKVKNDG